MAVVADLDDVQLGQQVAVRQRHVLPVQELAGGHLDVLDAVVVDLVRQRGAQILVQLLESLQQASLQTYARAHTHTTGEVVQMAERSGSRAINQKVAGSIPGCANYAVSLGKALRPTCLGDNVPVLTVSRSG